ncbi:MAG TPA: hypothetical protein DHU55_14240 [Blastocatellia bacterium]|jgi:hypothetical protein|nr:hypothetical protein [Blastocatellia bacterium]HCX30907.1 hypothetical protein [Blastocatellia bacterium]
MAVGGAVKIARVKIDDHYTGSISSGLFNIKRSIEPQLAECSIKFLQRLRVFDQRFDSDPLTEDDQLENLRVIREAKRATHKVFDVPDMKYRLAGVVLDLSYREGKPIERAVNVNIGHEELSETIEKIKNSPAAQEALKQLAAFIVLILVGYRKLERKEI